MMINNPYTKIPEYLKNPERTKELTKEWKLTDSHDKIELWEYHDNVNWSRDYCIKINGVVKLVFDDDKNKRSESSVAFYTLLACIE